MKQELKLPKDFRFSSSFEDFEECVSIAKKLMEEKKCLILFGTIKKIDVELSITQFEYESMAFDLRWEAFNEILKTEITVIIEQNLESEIEFERKLFSYLKKNNLTDEECTRVCEIKIQKRKLVDNELMNDESIQRYKFKRKTLNKSLSSLEYEINKYVFDDEKEIKYVYMNIGACNNLLDEEIPIPLSKISVSDKEKRINFVCDKEDIQYMISKLNEIVKRL